MQGTYGPVVYRGYTRAGQLSEAYIEEELGDGTSGAERSVYFQLVYSSMTKSFIKYNIFPPKRTKREAHDVDPANNATVSISSQHLIDLSVRENLQRSARFRFMNAMTKFGNQSIST